MQGLADCVRFDTFDCNAPFAMPGQADDAPGMSKPLKRQPTMPGRTGVEMGRFVNATTVAWAGKAVRTQFIPE